jgi:segregation and condensation protein A
MYNIATRTYEGPFELLLDIIKDGELDVSRITVLDIVKNPDIKSVDEGSEFIVDAANLLYIKSEALLPKQPEVEVKQEEVDAQKLLELYSKMKEVAQGLEKKELRQKEIFYRDVNLASSYADEEFKEATLHDLLLAFKAVLAYMPKEDVLNISREGITVKQKMNEILDLLETAEKLEFVPFLKSQRSKEHVITAFLAVLELIKLGLLMCRQNIVQRDIYLFRKR